MKKSTYHIICAWALLLCFITGQYMVYAHQHFINKGTYSATKRAVKNSSRTTVSEKCPICDSMHHVNMELTKQACFDTFTGTIFTFKTFQYDFTSIALILSSGRGPPVVS